MFDTCEQRPMSVQEPCEFSHKNDILSLIEEILQWTKNERSVWYDDFYLTSAATAVLLKMGNSKDGLNISWIEQNLQASQRQKRYLTTVDLFAGYCLGLLCLYLANRKKANEIVNSVRNLETELGNLNWMNNPKTVAFLTILMHEVGDREKIRVIDMAAVFEEYLDKLITGDLESENLAYALFCLSFIDPKKVREFCDVNKEQIKRLIAHNRVEIRALTLDFLDKAGISCAETTYQTIWDFFKERHYGVIERSLLGRIVSAVYNKSAGLPSQDRDVIIKESTDIAKIEISTSKSSLERMIQVVPPIDQLSIVALSLLWSSYDHLYLFSRSRYEEYRTLRHLERKDTHTPVDKQALSKICSKLRRYEVSKMILKYGFLSILIFVLLPYAGFMLGAYLFVVPEPWRGAAGGILATFAGVWVFLQYMLKRASKEYADLKTKIEKLRGTGVWENS